MVVAGIHFATVPVTAADKAYWAVSGPPCPAVTAAALAVGRPLTQVFTFDQGRFARSSGAVVCTGLADKWGVAIGSSCQFHAPRRLAVWSKGGDAYYDIPSALPATVTVSQNRPPRCVLAAHYSGD